MIQNIFIAHTPFHVFIAEMIVKNILGRSECENVIFLELSRDHQNVNRDLWSKIDYLENVGNSTLGRKRYLMSEKNIEIIKQYAHKDMETHLFMSDIAWPMNNRIFFDKHLRSSVKYCLFSDGLGTYTSPKVTKVLFIRGLAKSINGLLHRGVRYKNYLGDQIGVDRKKIEYIYAPNVKFVNCKPSKKKEVSFDSTHGEVKFNKEKCLFLDQPFWLHMQDSKWYAITEMATKFIKSLDVKEFYYKNHHFRRKVEEIYFESQGFSMIDSDKCAERIVAENDFGIVVSYHSAALFNLKCMYHDKLRCISLFSKRMSLANGYNDDTSDKIIDLFNKVNVEVVKMP